MTRFDLEAWARWASAWPERRTERGPVVDGSIVAFADRWLPAGQVLDAGCGDGFYTRALAASGRDPVGVDVTPALLDVARTEAPGLAFLEADLARLRLPEGQFDGVLCLTVLEWVAEPLATLRELRRVTRPGGVLVLGVLGAGNRTRDLHAERFFGQSPMNGLLPWELALLAEREGLASLASLGVTRDGELHGGRDAMTRAMIWLFAFGN